MRQKRVRQRRVRQRRGEEKRGEHKRKGKERGSISEFTMAFSAQLSSALTGQNFKVHIFPRRFSIS
jgi:hypothetical protein